MDEEISGQEQSTASVSKQQRCGKGRAREPKGSSRNRKASKSNSTFTMEKKWTVTEKTRLLEALKRYNTHDISSIATLIGTKSEQEIGGKIRTYRKFESIRSCSDSVDGSETEKAPIEAWINLVDEMVKHEPADYAQFIPKVLGIIARNEQFADSGFQQLKWRHIYQFLVDITEDKLEVQKLTDMESLVVLDMMHSIGDTLLTSDTSEQRRILDFKYNLLNFKTHTTRKQDVEMSVNRIAQALSNDLWDLGDLQGTSSNKPSSSSLAMDDAISAQHGEHSADARNVTEMNSQSTASTSYITQRSGTQAASSMSGTDESPYVVPGTSGSTTNSSGAVQQCSGQQTNKQNICNEETNLNNISSAEVGNGEASSGVGLVYSQRYGKKFVRPKYFTLNPLCLPTQLIAFKPKTGS